MAGGWLTSDLGGGARRIYTQYIIKTGTWRGSVPVRFRNIPASIADAFFVILLIVRNRTIGASYSNAINSRMFHDFVDSWNNKTGSLIGPLN